MAEFGDFIKAGSAILDGVLARREAEQMNNRNLHEQRVFAQNSLQWRVNDANAAGIHPIYAMGAQLPSFAPVAVQTGGLGLTEAGAALGNWADDNYRPADGSRNYLDDDGVVVTRNIPRRSNREMRRRMSELQLSNVERDQTREDRLVEQQIEESRARIRALEWQINKDWTAAAPGQSDAATANVQMKPNEIVRNKSGVTHGLRPLFDEYDFQGLRMLLPQASTAGEALEGMESFPIKVAVVAANMRYYGPGWIDRAKRTFGWSMSTWQKVLGEIAKNGGQ